MDNAFGSTELGTFGDTFGTTSDGNYPNDLIVDFGPGVGLWRWMNNTQWWGLIASSPSVMAVGDIDGTGLDDVLAGFPGSGLWRWMNNTSWQKLHDAVPEAIVIADLDDNGIMDAVIDFPSLGLWRWMNNTSWQGLHIWSPDGLAAGDLDDIARDDVVVDFGNAGAGLWRWMNNTGWQKLHNSNAVEDMVMGDLDGSGRDDVVIDFGSAIGLWRWMNNASWARLHNASPEGLVAGDLDDSGQEDVVVDFGNTTGLWRWMNNASWAKLHNQSPEEMEVADLDDSGSADVVIDFPSLGLWRWMNNTSWQRLHPGAVDDMAAGNLDDSRASEALRCGDVAAGSIDAPAETDLYSFFGRAGDVVTLTLVETGGNFVGRAATAHLTLSDHSGTTLGDLTANNRLQITLPASGTYFVRVTASDLVTTGSYSLGLACLRPPSPPPVVLSCGDVSASSIGAPAETDLYSFSGEAGEVITLTLVETGGNFVGRAATAQLTLFVPSGAQLDVFNANDRREYELPESGDYLVRVTASNLVTTGNYSLGLACLRPPSPPPVALSCGDVSASSIDVPAETDLYSFSGEAGEVITLTLVETGGNFVGRAATAQLTLFDPSGAELDVFTANNRREYELPASGDYLVRVTASNLVTTGTYSLGLTCLQPPRPDPVAPNCGDVSASSIGAPAETDLYSFSGEAGEVITLTLVETGGNFVGRAATAQLTFFDPSGAELDVLTANNRRQYTLPASGDYLIRVTASNLVTTGNYSLGLTCLRPPGPDPVALSCGDVSASSIGTPAETDLYSFSGAAGEVITLTLVETSRDFVGHAATAQLTLFDPSGAQLDVLTANNRRQYTLPASGDYLVRVMASNLVTTGNYSLGLACLRPPGPPPMALSCGDASASSIGAPAETDLYSFTGEAGAVITLTLVETGGNFVGRAESAQLTLFDPSGLQQDIFAANDRRQYTLSASGDYLVRVTASNLVTTGTYSLGLACLQPPSPPPMALSCGDVLAGSIGAPAETDLYSFTGEAGEVIALTLVETGGAFVGRAATAQLTLFEPPSGTQRDVFNANDRREYTLTASGIHLVRVTASNAVTTGSYSLGLECISPP